MVAVGALAPKVFESVVFGNFSHTSINSHKNDVENVTNLLTKYNIKHPQFEISNMVLDKLDLCSIL